MKIFYDIFNYIQNGFLFLESFGEKQAAIIYIFMSSLLFSLMNLCVKFAHTIPVYQVIYDRAFLNLIFSYFIISNNSYPLIYQEEETNKLLYIRGILGGLAFSLYFHALYLLPISTANILMRMNPLWVGILGSLFYNEPYKLIYFITTLISFSGVIFIVKPDFIFNSNTNEKFDSDSFLGVLFCLINGICSSLIMLTIGKLKGKTNVVVIVYYFNFFNMIFGGLGLFYEKPKSLDLKESFLVFIIGVLGFIAQLFRSRALFLQKAFFISIVSYFGILFAYISDVFILKIELSTTSNIGGILILSSMIFLVVYEKKIDS